MSTGKNIFICAGEHSGDTLGAGLIQALKKIYPDAHFTGIAGPEMLKAGCKALHTLDALSAMGIIEVIPKIPKILRLRSQLVKQLIADPPDVYIGIDAPDFNLPVEAKLKSAGIKTVHYVSPTVWAWRSGRVKKIKKSVDLLLSIFPFEEAFLAERGVPVRYVGHRSADHLPDLITRDQARQQLQLRDTEQVVAILPGSRMMEINTMLPLFLDTAAWCSAQIPTLRYMIAAANPRLAARIKAIIQEKNAQLPITVELDKTHAVIKAADAVLLTSGTATLETFLLDQPMVVAYRMNPVTWMLVWLLIKVNYCALPNLLAGEAIVPEYVQGAVTVPALGASLLTWLQDKPAVDALRARYSKLRTALRCQADTQAAQAINELLSSSLQQNS